MKKFIIILTLVVSVSSFGQAPDDTNSKSGIRSGEFNLSVSLGFSLFGPLQDIESTMISSGFDDTSIGFFGGGLITHPTKTRSVVYDIEGTYFLNKQMGVSLNFGLVDKVEVHGFNGSDSDPQVLGDYLFLQSEIKTLSVNYAYRSENGLHTFFIGPAFVMHRTTDEGAPGFASKGNDNKKFGAFIGYSYQIVRKKLWAIAIKANYRWALKSEIGPFYTTGTSEFPVTKVNISCLNIGFGIMFIAQGQE